MGVYDRQRATATRLIAKYGEKVVWREAVQAEDADRPWLGTTAKAIEHNVIVLFTTSNSSVRHLIEALSGGTIPQGESLGYMATVDFNPSIADVVIRTDGTQFRVKSIDPLQLNAERPILYTLEFNE